MIFANFGFHIRASRISSSIVFWVFRSSFPDSGYVSNSDFEISFQEFVSRHVGYFVGYFLRGILFKSVRGDTVWNKNVGRVLETDWQYLSIVFGIGLCYKICPKFSLFWRRCFIAFFCLHELFMNLGGWHTKNEVCQNFDTQALQHSCSNVWLKECMHADIMNILVSKRLDRWRRYIT